MIRLRSPPEPLTKGTPVVEQTWPVSPVPLEACSPNVSLAQRPEWDDVLLRRDPVEDRRGTTKRQFG